MANAIQSYLDYLGMPDRLGQAMEAEKKGQWNGVQYGDIPGLGGVLRPLGLAGNTLGLGLEGLGTTGKAIGGLAAIPFVYGEAYTGSAPDSPGDTIRSRRLVDQGIGNLLAHPGRTIDELRHSENDITSYLAGILEMASDPTNVLAAPVSGYVKAGKVGRAAARAGAGGTLSQEFFAGKLREMDHADEAIQRIDALLEQEGLRNAAYEGGQANIQRLKGQLDTAKGNTEAARFGLQEFKDYYKEARGGVAEGLKSARASGQFKPVPRALKDEAGNLFENPEAKYVKQANEARRKTIVEEILAQYPGGPKQGMTYHEFIAEPRQALYQAVNEEKKIAELYRQAIKDAPEPIRYSTSGKPLGKRDKGLMRIGDVNAQFNADEAAVAANMPLTSAEDAALVGLDQYEPDSPQAIASALDRIARAAKLTPDEIAEQLARPGDIGTGAFELADARNIIKRNPLQGPAMPEQRDILSPETRGFATRMSDLLSHAIREGVKEQRAAMARPGVAVSFGQLASIWKGVATQTLRNVFMDEIYSRIMLLSEDVRQAAYTRSKDQVIQRLREAEGGVAGKENPLLLLGDVSDILSAQGLGRDWKPKQVAAFYEKIGINPFEAETENIKNLSAMQQLFGSSIVGLANPLRASVGVAALPLGYLAPMRQRMFHIVNQVTHMAAKGEAFKQGYLPYIENSAKRLLAAAEAEGRDVSRLRGFGYLDQQTGERILQEGAFTTQQVQMFLGPRFAAEWERMLGEGLEAGYARATQVFGNYAKRGTLERSIDKFFPFLSWSWRNYGRVSMAVLSHPAVAAGAIQLLQAEMEDAKANKRPAYLATTVGFDKDTPLIGVLARIFSPEQEASVRINPLSVFNPFGAELFGGGKSADEADTMTPYQRAEELAGLFGASPSPVIQAGAYVTGQDYQSPSPLSRYNAVDQAFDDLGINAEVPSLAHGTLRGAREMITGKQDTYDPIEAKLKELVFEKTGAPLSDTRNTMLAAQLAAGIDPQGLRAQAERIVDLGGGGRALFNANSPISASVVTDTAEAKRAAGQPPHSYEDIQAAKTAGLTVLARLWTEENDQWYLQNPIAATGKNARVNPANITIARGAEKRRLLQQSMGVV